MSDDLFPRRGWRMWVAVLGGAGLLVAVMAGFALMIAQPDRRLVLADRRAEIAPKSLQTLLAAEKQRAEFLPFEDQSAHDASALLGVAFPPDAPHRFSARVLDTGFLLVARGDLDEDAGIDDWQLASNDEAPLHVYDDARDLWVDAVLVDVYGLPTTGENPDLGVRDRARLRRAMRAYRDSRQARVILEDLGRDELKYHDAKHAWLFFDALTPDVWRTLSDSTSGTLSHHVRATASGTSALLTAIGDVDGDPCVDVWATKPGNFIVEHLQDDVALDDCPNGIHAP